MDKIILQIDSTCGNCNCELPKGTACYSDEFEDIRCMDCYENELYGEIYG
jgi:hypothetical protein